MITALVASLLMVTGLGLTLARVLWVNHQQARMMWEMDPGAVPEHTWIQRLYQQKQAAWLRMFRADCRHDSLRRVHRRTAHRLCLARRHIRGLKMKQAAQEVELRILREAVERGTEVKP